MRPPGWRHHRFIEATLAPDDIVEVLWPTGMVGVITQFSIALGYVGTSGTVMAINDTVIAQLSVQNLPDTSTGYQIEIAPGLEYPLFADDVLRVSNYGNDGAFGSVAIYGYVYGWGADAPPLFP